MYGKIINGKLVFAGSKIKIENGYITEPTEEQLRELGYKVVEYTERPEYDKEEEKLVETYREDIEQTTILVCYEKVALTDEEHNEVIKQEIIEEEAKITTRNILDFAIDTDSEALERIQSHRTIIIKLRTKLR